MSETHLSGGETMGGDWDRGGTCCSPEGATQLCDLCISLNASDYEGNGSLDKSSDIGLPVCHKKTHILYSLPFTNHLLSLCFPKRQDPLTPPKQKGHNLKIKNNLFAGGRSWPSVCQTCNTRETL